MFKEQVLKAIKNATALVACCIASSALLAAAANEKTIARGFICSIASGSPATSAVTSTGKHVPLIRWTSTTFDNAGWTQQRRCEEVSSRFDDYHKQGRLKYITTGRINGLPVICTATNLGAGCDGLLYTLKPGQDATATLWNLLDIRVKARGPLNETNSRFYVSLDELLSIGLANAVEGILPAKESTHTQPSTSLW